MSDNDLLCKGIHKQRWGGAYTQLAEWGIDPQTIAYSHIRALKKDLQELGNPPIYHLRDQAERFNSIRVELLMNNIANQIAEFEKIRLNAWNHGGNKRAMNLAQEVSMQYLSDILQSPSLNNHFYPMTRSYIENVYVSKYEAPVLRYSNLSKDVVSQRFREIRPIIEVGMDNFASQLVRTINVEKLRIPRGIAPPKFNSIEDLGDFLNENIRMN